MKVGLLAVSAACAVLAGCSAARSPHTAVVPRYGLAADHSYIDIEPGWRLRVVTPLLRSGGFRLKTTAGSAGDSAGAGPVVLRADPDFLGYELSYYSVGPGARVRLKSVEAVTGGRTEVRQKPAAALFAHPGDARYLRLVFLTRASAADHDMALLTARRYEDLESWTAKLRSAPEEACRATRYCSWVPGGIAVAAEQWDAQSGAWKPADGGGRRR